MGQKSGQGAEDRVPPAVDGISVNCCVKPQCRNFRVPAVNFRNDPCYTISGMKNDGQSIKCRECGSFYAIKSNLAISEEIERLNRREIRSNVYRQDGDCCHNVQCPNFGLLVVDFPPLYRRIGNTPAGNQRFQCKSCGKRFTQGSKKRKSHPQNKSHLNDALFKFIVNKGVGRRVSEIMDLSPPTSIRKVDMFYERSIAFLHERESRLPDMKLGRLRLATDRQDYNVNWTVRKDKRNVILTAIGTADLASGYVFGMDVNYDSRIDLECLEASNEFTNDLSLKPFNRCHARLWTSPDYLQGVKAHHEYIKRVDALLSTYENQSLPLPLTHAGLTYALDQMSDEQGLDVNEQSSITRLPQQGAQVHLEYTMYAHFQRLYHLIGHAWQLRFYVDQEAGINRAVNVAFGDRVVTGDCHALYIKINKELTVDERRALVRLTSKTAERMIKDGFLSSEREAYECMMYESLQTPIRFKGRSEQWYSVPIHRINECEKHVAFISNDQLLSEEDKVNIMLDASLHPIDTFFMSVRRRLSALERPIHSQSNTGRVWTGYSPYNPAVIEKQIQIMRLYYNYCLPGKDGRTPAERLGLAKGPVEIRKILYP